MNAIREELLARLRSAAESGDLQGIGVDFWDRGGPPGRGYESDVLIVRPDVEVLLRTRFDDAYAPPFRTEEHTRPAEREGRKALAELALRALEGTFAEETPAKIGGVTRISIKVYLVPDKPSPDTEPPAEVVKTFFQRLPEELASLGDLARARMSALRERAPVILSTPAR